ncbi:RNA polymerase sigma factor [Bacteroides reticulotermitis]|uniref:RNA polymerase sigma factor n=1 Tax=Bacteroides reticulotermitis TaxID=1133319 RepID=UPI001FCBC34B|nr:sigma-70 family RNA polymerase sigma factor [Bacteroides reticulotermitis]
MRKDSKLKYCDSIPDFIAAEQSESNENYHKLVEALYRLNEVDKSIMLLYLEDYSYEEISDIVGISASNVGVKIHRLKVQLQKQLNN